MLRCHDCPSLSSIASLPFREVLKLAADTRNKSPLYAYINANNPGLNKEETLAYAARLIRASRISRRIEHQHGRPSLLTINRLANYVARWRKDLAGA